MNTILCFTLLYVSWRWALIASIFSLKLQCFEYFDSYVARSLLASLWSDNAFFLFLIKSAVNAYLAVFPESIAARSSCFFWLISFQSLICFCKSAIIYIGACSLGSSFAGRRAAPDIYGFIATIILSCSIYLLLGPD